LEVKTGLPDTADGKRPPIERYGLRVVLFAAALVLVTIPFGLLVHQVRTDGPFTAFDLDVAESLNGLVSERPWLIDLLQVISFLGKPITLVLLVALPGVWILWRREWRLAAFLAVTCIVGGLVNSAVKLVVGRARPVVDVPVADAIGLSFPSGHSFASVVCFGALLLVLLPLVPRAWRRAVVGLTVALVLAIGASRLALGLHFVTDVVGGFVLGLAWLGASVAAFEIWRQDRGLRPTAPLSEGVEPEESRDLVRSGPSAAPRTN
jgi:undecaprenyl-diphosphatase